MNNRVAVALIKPPRHGFTKMLNRVLESINAVLITGSIDVALLVWGPDRSQDTPPPPVSTGGNHFLVDFRCSRIGSNL